MLQNNDYYVKLTPAQARDSQIKQVRIRLKKDLSQEGLSPQKIAGLKRAKNNKIKKIAEEFDEIINAKIPRKIEIKVKWSKGGVYGRQAKAEVRADSNFASSRWTTGCGYDKESTAVSWAFNNIFGLRKLAYKALPLTSYYAVDKYSNRFRCWAMGVGMSAYKITLEKLGYKLIAEAHGSNYSYYKLQKAGK